MTRASTTVLAFLLITLTATSPRAAKPNILFIMSDDHAAHARTAGASFSSAEFSRGGNPSQ